MDKDANEEYTDLVTTLSTFSGHANALPNFKIRVSGEETALLAQLRAQIATIVDEKPEVLAEAVRANDVYQILLGGKDLDDLGHRQLLVTIARNAARVDNILIETAGNITDVIVSKNTLIEGERAAIKKKIELVQRAHLRDRLVGIFTKAKFHLEEGRSFSPVDVRTAFKKIQGLITGLKISKGKASTSILYLLGVVPKEDILDCPRLQHQSAFQVPRGGLDEIRSTEKPFEVEDTEKPFEVEDTEKPFEVEDTEKPFEVEDIENYNVSRIEQDIRESLHWATDFIKNIMSEVSDLIRKYEATGEIQNGYNESPSLNQALRNQTPFEILEYLYTGDNIRDLNDAQILWVIGFVHFIQRRRIQSIEAVNTVNKTDASILESMFENNKPEGQVDYPTLKFTGQEFKATGSRSVLSCRQLRTYRNVTPHQKMVHMVEVDDKLEDSRVYKYFGKSYGNVGPDCFPDEIRTRGILAGITSIELQTDENLQNMVTENLIATARGLGMNKDRTAELEAGSIRSTDLEPGQFAVEKDFNHSRYPKISLIGVTADGSRIEEQLITIDTHAFEEANGSGMHHKNVKRAELKFKMAKDLAPQSISPITHQVCNWELNRLTALQKATAAARATFMTQNPNFFKKAA